MKDAFTEKKIGRGGGGGGMPERVKEDRMRGRGGVRKKNLREEVGRRGVKKKKCRGCCQKKLREGGGGMPERGKEDEMQGEGCCDFFLGGGIHEDHTKNLRGEGCRWKIMSSLGGGGQI